MTAISPHPSRPSDPGLTQRAQFWIARLAAQDMGEDELQALEDWLAADAAHARAFARERALWQDLAVVGDALAPPPPRWSARRFIMRATPLALAASLVAALLGPAILVQLRADHRTGAGEVRSLTLSDGTQVMLDSRSALSVDIDGQKRKVHLLAGRAWFDVRHDKRPFVVEAMSGQVQDIGTGFEMRRDERSVEVAVTQGAVLIHAPDGRDGPVMHAGERASYSGQGLTRLATQPADALAAWRKGDLLLDRQPVTSAIAEIARYRHAPVWTLGDFGGVSPVSGLFLIARPDEALETLVRMRGLRVMELPGGAVLIRPPAAS